MSVQFAGSRSMDERRRRRLAANGDGGAESAEPHEEKSLPDCVPAELCAASPWIPLSRWKLWSIAGLLLAGLIAVEGMVYQTPSFRPELAPALDPLFQGDHPKLAMYLETMFWTLSGQLALLVGWHRSRSRLDFRGRYRIWPWAAAVMFFCGLCAATDLHIGLGTVIDDLAARAQFGHRIGWTLPAMVVMLPLWMLMDRDVRRSLTALVLLRITLLLLLGGAIAGLWQPAGVDPSLIRIARQASGLFGSAGLMLSLWMQGWYVAYVTPDPPVAAPFCMPRLSWNPLAWLLNLITRLFKRRESPPAPVRKRKKSEEAGTTRRKRKTKRTSSRRSRSKPAEEEEEEVGEEEAEESSDVAHDDEAVDETDSSADQPDDAWDDAEVATPSTQASAKQQQATTADRQPNSSMKTAASTVSESAAHESSDEEDDGDDNDAKWRVDGPSPEQLKGLSKRQRRALIKQYRDQQRNR